MKYFIDCEFNERYMNASSKGVLELISIAVVSEKGKEFYAVLSEGWNDFNANHFVRENVLPNIVSYSKRVTRHSTKHKLIEFIGKTRNPEFWGFYSAYDWVCFCWLFGDMVSLPISWPMYCHDLKQEIDRVGIPESELKKSKVHNALEDAKCLRENYLALQEIFEKG